MIWFLYNTLFTLGFILLLPRFLCRMCRRGGYRSHFWERIGRYDEETLKRLREGSWVWIQAVSVGEVFVAFRFIEELRSRHPGMRFVLSTTTSTGHAIAQKKIGAEDVLIYFPVDYPPVMKRILGIIQPAALILIECELWPNMIRLAKRRNTPVLLVNGRISKHSYSGYRKLRMFTKRLLQMTDVLCVQSEGDRKKLADLGANPEVLNVMGSAKYEVAQLDPEGERRAREILKQAGIAAERTILLGGSTWPGEEGILADLYKALREQYPDLMLVLAPRHVERTPDVVRQIEMRELTWARRSQVDEGADTEPPDVFLIDTTGELMNFYPCAAIIFIGKSLTQHGGQNIIEPALHGKPIIVGPNMENFPVVIDDFLAAGALIQVRDEEELRESLLRLLAGDGERSVLGERAARLVREKAGAVTATVDILEDLLVPSGQSA